MEYSSWLWQHPVLDPRARFQELAAFPGKFSDLFRESFAIPFAIGCMFICLQILHALVSFIFHSSTVSSPQSQVQDTTPNPNPTEINSKTWTQTRIADLGGSSIFVFAIARLFGCLILLAFSLRTLVACACVGGLSDSLCTPRAKCPEVYIALSFAYSSLLAVISLTVKPWSTFATRYNILLLLAIFSTYAYRDIWPLATYYGRPADITEGNVLWLKIGLTFFTAILIPLFVPRRYIPVDAKEPMTVTNDEQTCSIFSLVFYTYLDPIIFLGARVPHLSYDQLPPLSDTDYAKHLTENAFPHLDPFRGAKKRHLFFGLMRVFRKEYSILFLAILCQGATLFLPPIALNRILNYLETGGRDASIRPWLWILFLFVGPIFKSIAFQWYIFIATRTLVRTEGLLTQLVFEHSLRIRLKAESSTEKRDNVDQDNVTVVGTPDSASIAESSTSNGDESSSASTAAASREPTGDSSSSIKTSSLKGKAKDTPSPPSTPKATGKSKDDSNLIGKINNLVTTDLSNIVDARDFLLFVIFVPIQVCLCMIFLQKLLGWSAYVGLALTVVLLPVPGYIAKLVQDVQRAKMKETDARIQDVTEAVSVLRMVKLFGWEARMSKRIGDRRLEELKWIWKLRVLEALSAIANHTIPTLNMIVTYGIYTLVMKQELTASKIFSSISVFSILRTQLFRISWQMSAIIKGKVSLERVQEFLQHTELLDSYEDSQINGPIVKGSPPDNQILGFKNSSFSWSHEPEDGSLTPSGRVFRLHVDGEVIFKPNCINLIVGPTGSGKTSMLMALLGEMHFIQTTADSWFNLPRDGGVAYAAQESWVQNETIRENILFGSPFDEVRYRKVLRQCALEKDLELFEAGDNTEVGEKGLTLSGGQKTRITLARAIYSQAKIILLDDVLAALDVHTSAWIVDKCFRGDLITGRTVLLVTHNLALTTPVAGFIVSLGQDGIVGSQSANSEIALHADPSPPAEAEVNREILEAGNEGIPPLVEGKLIVAEEIAKGHVTWKSIKLFLTGLGGDHPLIFFSLWLTGNLLSDWVNTFQVWFLGFWGSQYENHPPSEVRAIFYLTTYSSLLIAAEIIYTTAYIFYLSGAIRASKAISTALVDSVLGSSLRWLDETPTARIVARCTQDIRAVDAPIPQAFGGLVEMTMTLFTKIAAIIVFTPLFAFPGLGVAAFGFYLGNLYLKAQMSVKREMSNARSPLLSHFSAAIAGIVSIRAYGAEVFFKRESLKRVDHYVRIARMSYNLNRWIGVRIDLLGALFTSCLASYLVYGRSPGAANTGFSLNMALDFCTMILWWVRCFNELEVQTNSLERIQAYIDIDHEPQPTEAGKPPAAWPMSGDLRVENLSARYSQTGPTVLHDLSFHIKSGERIGVVGRTGSGKSSLTLALLRCIITEGSVFYDGVPTNTINLDSLRSKITIIPQTPELLSGTLRRNLDPFEQNDDATLNDALRSAGLFSVQEELGEARLTLDSNIASGGSNLSVGQRQILALARAMVRGSKLLILDEATSAIDYKTDAVIQTTLREQLGSDVTVITVAHRLQTIMDADKIMVLDGGRIVEFDTPEALLKQESGMLKALVDGSGDKADLYAMAEGKLSGSSHHH